MARKLYKIRKYDDGTVAVLDPTNNPVEYFSSAEEANEYIADLHAQLVKRDPGIEIPDTPLAHTKTAVRELLPELVELAPTPASKAENVRAAIEIVKASTGDQEDAILWAIKKLGMPRSLARTYVLNNWNR